MKLGDRITRKPFCSERKWEGKVVYIHPRRRWYTLEFALPYPGGVRTYRECFFNPPKVFAEVEKRSRAKI
jgi:hypothetical protein